MAKLARGMGVGNSILLDKARLQEKYLHTITFA